MLASKPRHHTMDEQLGRRDLHSFFATTMVSSFVGFSHNHVVTVTDSHNHTLSIRGLERTKFVLVLAKMFGMHVNAEIIVPIIIFVCESHFAFENLSFFGQHKHQHRILIGFPEIWVSYESHDVCAAQIVDSDFACENLFSFELLDKEVLSIFADHQPLRSRNFCQDLTIPLKQTSSKVVFIAPFDVSDVLDVLIVNNFRLDDTFVLWLEIINEQSLTFLAADDKLTIVVIILNTCTAELISVEIVKHTFWSLQIFYIEY